MRAVLIDWIVQVHHRFGMVAETLFLTCNYIDRFLSSKVVSIGKLQLVGATALFVAAKYEEIFCPSVHEIVYMVDNGYSAAEILSAEKFMLSMLQFELGWPGPMSFLRRISKADDYDSGIRTIAKYLIEATLMDERFVSSPPSFVAAGAHYLARVICRGQRDWVRLRIQQTEVGEIIANYPTQTLPHIHFSGYTLGQLKPLVTKIYECLENAKRHHGAIFDKYTDERFNKVSLHVQRFMTSCSSIGIDYVFIGHLLEDADSSSLEDY